MPTKNPYVGFRKDQRRTFSLWERFNSGVFNTEGLADPYVQLMINEWTRCAKLGVDPGRSFGVKCSADSFQKHLDDNRQLLDAARASIDKVTEQVSAVSGVILLADAEGVILYIAGNSAVRDLAAARSGVVEGSCWLETVAGTNGMGSALSKREPVHVFSTEHFCEGWHTWTCAATPLLDADTHETIGVIDFTTVGKNYQEQALSLTTSMAQSITADYQQRSVAGRHHLLQRYETLCNRYPAEGLILLDERGRLVRTARTRGAAVQLTPQSLDRYADPIRIRMQDTGQFLGTAYVLSNEAFREAPSAELPAPPRARSRRKPSVMQEELEESGKTSRGEWDYQLIFDNAIVGICYSADELMVRCSRRFEEILGYEPGELDAANFQQISPTEEDYRSMSAGMARHFRKHRIYADERLMRRKNGELLWCALSVKKLNAGAQMRRSIWILQDISPRKNAEEALHRTHQRLESLVHERTQEVQQTNEALRQEIARRKRIEEKLRESRRKYRTVFETAPVGMFVTDSDGNVVEVNPAMARMIPKADIISSMRGAKSARITQIHSDGTEMKRSEFADARALREGKTIAEFELGARNRDGHVRWFSVISAPMPAKAFGTVVAHREITETKRMEEQERVQRMELARASRVNTMGEMAAAMAHELGQPLSTAVNFLTGCQLRLMAGDYDPVSVSETISQALHYTEQAGDILKNIRQFVRLHQPNTVLGDVHPIIRDTTSFMELESRQHRATIALALSADIPLLMLDAFEIKQLMVNLIKNGLEAMADVAGAQRILTVGTKLRGRKWVEVTVADVGHGVASHDMANIFKPFFSTKPNGMGLGLVICRSIVESHGGKLLASANVRGGATFTCLFPIIGQ